MREPRVIFDVHENDVLRVLREPFLIKALAEGLLACMKPCRLGLGETVGSNREPFFKRVCRCEDAPHFATACFGGENGEPETVGLALRNLPRCEPFLKLVEVSRVLAEIGKFELRLVVVWLIAQCTLALSGMRMPPELRQPTGDVSRSGAA